MLSRRAAESLTARVFDSATRHGGCRLDAYREGDTYYVDIDLPGVDPATIDVSADRAVLTVRAERKHVDAETAPNQPAATESAENEPAATESAENQPAASEPAAIESAENEPTASGPAQNQPVLDQQAKGGPTLGEPTRPGTLHLVGADSGAPASTREVALSRPMDTDRLDASYDNGVLTLRIPLAEQDERPTAATTTDLAEAA